MDIKNVLQICLEGVSKVEFKRSNLFVPKPNSNVMKRALHYSGIILWHPLKTVKNVEMDTIYPL
jgi:hypothetical protein